ncbi:MAG: hypothetical protein U1G07_06420 [Verrucomicrobiota bacterium]
MTKQSLPVILASQLLIFAASCESSHVSNRHSTTKTNCGNPSNTIKPAQYLGDYPITDCLGTNTTTPVNQRIFIVKDWAAGKDDNGRNIHTYSFDKLKPCDPCYGTAGGVVDDLYIIECESHEPCFPNTPLQEDQIKITLQKTH